MAWVFLLIAGILEVVWAIGIKYSEGFTKLWPSLATIAALIMSLVFLSRTLETLPLGTAYAIWTGIGAVGTAVMGMILFDESRDLVRVLSILLIVVGIIGLKFTSPQ